ncbi:MAG: enoyl-CoA hydratase-related protein, partial [Boseongicola sp.]
VAAGLVAAIGARNAAMMLMTGDPYDAKQMRDWGLVSEVVAAPKLMARAQEIATRIAENAPLATQMAKINLAAALNMAADQAVRYERDLQTISFATEDANEGRRAFAEKRKPVFYGR